MTGVAHQDAPLLSPLLPVGVGLLTLTALVATAVRITRRHLGSGRLGSGRLGSGRLGSGRRWAGGSVSALAAAGSLFLVVLTVASAVNAYAGYLPTPDAAERFLTGRESVSIAGSASSSRAALLRLDGGPRMIAAGDTRWTSSSLRLSDPALRIRNRQVLVALPPGYRTGSGRYPVLYLFSGYPGRAADWFVSGRITQTLDALAAQGRVPYFICVAPDVNGGFFDDSETVDAVGGAQVETWVTRDVVGYVDAHFRTTAQRGARVLAGMSSGGFAALNVALRHQDEFGVSLALEPYGDPGNVTKRLFGGNVALLRANSPSYYAPSESLTRRLAFFLDVGSGGDVGAVRALARSLNARREPVVLRIETGQRHTWTEAAAGLPYALSFAATQLARPAALGATYPAVAFPATGQDPFGEQVSADGETTLATRISCDRRIKAVGLSASSVARECAGFDGDCGDADLARLPRLLTGAILTRDCPPRARR